MPEKNSDAHQTTRAIFSQYGDIEQGRLGHALRSVGLNGAKLGEALSPTAAWTVKARTASQVAPSNATHQVSADAAQ